MPTWTKEQKEAIEKCNSNIIVSAGAGSGKTAVLSERVLNKLENGIHVNELLILTFTRAAADEMKNRIRKKISKIPEYKEELNLLNSSYITTFDSFALSIVKRYHYILNITKNVSITDESIVKIEKKKLLDETFEELYSSNNENFNRLIDTYCIKNDKSLRDNILKISDKISDYIDKDKYINYVRNEFYQEDNINDLINEYISLLEEKKHIINLELDNLSLYFDYDYIEKVNESIQGIMSCDIDTLCLYSKVSLPSVPRGSSDEAKEAKKRFQKSIDDLLQYSSFGNKESIIEDIINSKQNILTILDIVEVYLSKIKKYKEDNNIYTFTDIAFLAIKVVKENENIRNELKYFFKEIMIDEYQDTNDVQETFIKLIANNNVYMVGDIKQAIYRFRGSNPLIFKEKYDNYSNNIDGYKIDLIKNFRSRKEVLDNINKIFDLIMDDDLGGANYKATHEMVYGNTSYDDEKDNLDYNLDVLEYQNNQKETRFSNIEVEIFTIAKDIKNKLKNNLKVFDKETSKLRDATYNDFVIILDRSKYFEDFKKIFEYLDIPLTILKDGKLNTSTDILLIKNIIDFIIKINKNEFDNEFKYDFLSIGRSFLYEYTDEYLFDVITENRYKETTIYKELSSIENINSKTSSEIIIDILNVTDFYNKIYKIGDYENINVRLSKIYEISQNLNSIGYSIENLRDYLNEIIDNELDIKYTMYSSNEESVKILTIHKSKGLEYPVCYFADLDHDFNTSDIKDKFITDKKYGLIIPSSLEDVKNSVIKELYKYNFLKEEISEKIRLFYVTVTRAREKMIVVIPSKETQKLEKNNDGVIDVLRRIKFIRLSDFIYSIKSYHQEFFKEIDINELNLTKSYLYNKEVKQKELDNNIDRIEVKEINIENEIIKKEHFSKVNTNLLSKEEQKNIDLGLEIHTILELIDFKNYDLSLIENEYIKDKISKFLNNKILDDINEANIYKEYEFIYEEGNISYHGIIDLLIEYKDRINIIDYKLKNIKDNNYIKQLNGYKKYIEKLTSKKTSIYLYSILDNKIEEL